MPASSKLREGVLFCLGNPLLDITSNVDPSFLESYGLKPDDAILAEERHYTMYEEMLQKYQVEYSGGGSVQNAARVIQWILKVPNVVTYAGCVGKDKFGEILSGKSREAGVHVNYMIHDTEPTGKCAVLITGKNRSLCAYLAAANCFQKDHLLKDELQQLINKAQYFYIEGFHLTVSPESILYLAQHACDNEKTLAMNLNAPFLITLFKEPMMKALPYVDILMGNKNEALAFAETHNFETKDVHQVALKLSHLPKENEKKPRMVVITQGKDPVVVAYQEKITEYPVPPVEDAKIIDTNAAGDGFAGGFLAKYIEGKPLDVCVRCGIYAAEEVIQRYGCSLPPESNFMD